ncbi:YhgE/Pip domain-containing protein [Leucobacter japonicus]|uniref:YhgE/Pip domain-containing protein n=1 Tax=Leucobacter japonicus TaxID=1461259 RepID=UPI0006A76454|nr:YhgE/Pip domain-containing protein [Leucobacter japonicus]
MTAALTRLKTDRPVRWTTLLGILLVPLTVAGVLLWGLWNPTERLENVTAAVVNLDQAVELDGQTVPLGRVLAGELIGEAGSGSDSSAGSDSDADGTNFTWVLTDADDAEAGVADGRYATVVTIPKSFSADATSLSGDPADATQARIDVTESHRGRLIDTALSNIVTQTATRVLNEQLGEQFIDGVYVGFNTLGDGITDAADGAAQLATGSTSLTDGAKQLDDGAAQLADGTQQLSDGTQQLATGAGTLSSGAGELSSGVGQYVAGAQQLADAYPQLQAGATTAVQQLQGVIAGLGQMQAATQEPSAQLEAGLGSTVAGVQSLVGDIEPIVTQCITETGNLVYCQGLGQQLQGHAEAIGAGVTTAGDGATGLSTVLQGASDQMGGASAADASAQLDQLTAGLDQFGTGISQLAAQGGQLTSGAAQLADGASQLSAGTSELAANAPQLADGASQLAEGTSELADGSAKLADGAGDLASGLDTAADQVPTTTDAEREQLAKTAATPVTAEGGSDELFNASGVPLFAGIALWAGALAAFLVLAPLWRRTRDAARGVGYITLRSALPALALGAVQGALAGIVLPIALGYDLGQGARFFGFALLAGIAFALMVQGLSALLGGVGRFIAFALLVVAFAVGIVSTVPGALAAVGDFSPLGSALSGFQSIATGGGSAGGAAVILTLWGALGLVFTAFAVMRARRAR